MTTRPLALTSLPVSAKVLLTLFLALIGVGYLAAVGNLYQQHHLADGVEGLTLDDLLVTFHGMEIIVEPPSADQPTPAAMSRMLEMIEPGGDMRKHVTKGGPKSVRALEAWLKGGASESTFKSKSLAAEGDPSADDVIARRCLRCHNADGGEKADAPYGPDLFTTDYAMIHRFAAPGSALAAPSTDATDGPTIKTMGPMTMPHLLLITHIHMLSIPVFTLIVSGLFYITCSSSAIKRALVPIPMICLVFDFSGWWLARIAEPFIYVIAAAGAVYGLTLAVQLLSVAASLWSGRQPANTSST